MDKRKKFVKQTVIRELGAYEFYCDKCQTIHKKTPYAVAQGVKGVELIFTCKCGNKIDL